MDRAEELARLVRMAQKILYRLEAWEDSARIRNRQTNSRESLNEAQNYHLLTQELSAALKPFLDDEAATAYHAVTGQ